jgi:hypothetical protein
MTVEFMLDVVAHSGFSRTDGTFVLDTGSVIDPFTSEDGGPETARGGAVVARWGEIRARLDAGWAVAGRT